MVTDLSVPEAPSPVPEDMWSGTPNVVLDGERYAVGWQRFPDAKGGPAYVTARRSALGGRRVIGRYPLTADGWARAWAEFARLDPGAAEKTRAALARIRAARSTLVGLVLSAVDPPAEGFAVGQAYDLRYGEDGLRIARSGSPEAAAEFRYADVAAVQLTGFERLLAVSKFDLFFRPAWIQLDDVSYYRTHLRVQTVDRTIDFWHEASAPDSLSPGSFGRRIEPVNRAIRAAWLSAAADEDGRTEWLVSELSRLAERLDHGTLTRSDLELLRARVTGGY